MYFNSASFTECHCVMLALCVCVFGGGGYGGEKDSALPLRTSLCTKEYPRAEARV